MPTPFTDEDLDAAVSAGVVPGETAERFRGFVAERRNIALADEEAFRLLTGFNDIFVSVAIVLVLAALGGLSGEFLGSGGAGVSGPAATIAAASWALAEFFTRRRRMALPSLLLLISFVGAVVVCALGLLPGASHFADLLGVGAVGAGAAWLHWRRFRVPITVAAGVLTASLCIVFAVLGANESTSLARLAMAGLGLLTFALALRWDMSDRERKTRRADVAFWLHLTAAPMIVHPIFATLGFAQFAVFGAIAASPSPQTEISRALAASALYLALTFVALVVDRRALMVSSLAYMLFAMNAFVRSTGALATSFALSALIAGGGLLLLAAFWGAARRQALKAVPGSWRGRLPAG